LTQENELCSDLFDSFFNELDSRQGTMLLTTLYNLPIEPILVSFFNEVDTRQGTILKPVSFFNEVDTGKELSSQILFHFLTRLRQEQTILATNDHGFQLEERHVNGHTLIMASKRSSSEGRIVLWKEHMSRDSKGIRTSRSNNPIEFSMSITESKSKEDEQTVRGSLTSVTENMGSVAT
jgi:predicted aconitase with swiveling domain